MSGNDATNLTGQMLIAMPDMGDPRFAASVVFLCAHSEDGAMGLIVNKPIEGMSFSDLQEQLSIEATDSGDDPALFYGGPVETARGFVLHSGDYRSDLSTLSVTPEFSMTATQDVLEEIAAGRGPASSMMALGYAGWGPGQLEREIAENGWLVCPGDVKTVFDVPADKRWQAALDSIGVSPLVLSSTGGRA